MTFEAIEIEDVITKVIYLQEYEEDKWFFASLDEDKEGLFYQTPLVGSFEQQNIRYLEENAYDDDNTWNFEGRDDKISLKMRVFYDKQNKVIYAMNNISDIIEQYTLNASNVYVPSDG